ncbi:ADP-ribosyltransferase [Serratia fonticola]|uniref:ADP-ribosyltransferase n=1 Tax=Serratia fonticola TaxID=47917 RepID=UPI00192CE6A1|nr:ADP-ribosyltransferase [Serratia fonticola]MBL5825321.1 hypothetical protein [Serratia fonticola]
MTYAIIEKLPDGDKNGSLFDQYIIRNNIQISTASAIKAYQCADSEVMYCSAQELNHCLTLIHYGEESKYANSSKEIFGGLDCYENHYSSINEIESEFNSLSYSFTSDSVVYKGVSTLEPYYEILDISSRKVGDEIYFPGYLSTSIYKYKAETFKNKHNGILLVITGMDKARCIIPENRKIPNSPSSDIPEQEVLIDKGVRLKVIKLLSNNGIECEVL